MKDPFLRVALFLTVIFCLCAGLLVLWGLRTDAGAHSVAPETSIAPAVVATATAVAGDTGGSRYDWLWEVTRLGTVLLGVMVYFMPALNAHSRRHRERTAICVLNLLLGWTILGWIGALVWSCTSHIDAPPVAAPAPVPT